jgi:hypothetical protein
MSNENILYHSFDVINIEHVSPLRKLNRNDTYFIKDNMIRRVVDKKNKRDDNIFFNVVKISLREGLTLNHFTIDKCTRKTCVIKLLCPKKVHFHCCINDDHGSSSEDWIEEKEIILILDN